MSPIPSKISPAFFGTQQKEAVLVALNEFCSKIEECKKVLGEPGWDDGASWEESLADYLDSSDGKVLLNAFKGFQDAVNDVVVKNRKVDAERERALLQALKLPPMLEKLFAWLRKEGNQPLDKFINLLNENATRKPAAIALAEFIKSPEGYRALHGNDRGSAPAEVELMLGASGVTITNGVLDAAQTEKVGMIIGYTLAGLHKKVTENFYAEFGIKTTATLSAAQKKELGDRLYQDAVMHDLSLTYEIDVEDADKTPLVNIAIQPETEWVDTDQRKKNRKSSALDHCFINHETKTLYVGASTCNKKVNVGNQIRQGSSMFEVTEVLEELCKKEGSPFFGFKVEAFTFHSGVIEIDMKKPSSMVHKWIRDRAESLHWDEGREEKILNTIGQHLHYSWLLGAPTIESGARYLARTNPIFGGCDTLPLFKNMQSLNMLYADPRTHHRAVQKAWDQTGQFLVDLANDLRDTQLLNVGSKNRVSTFQKWMASFLAESVAKQMVWWKQALVDSPGVNNPYDGKSILIKVQEAVQGLAEDCSKNLAISSQSDAEYQKAINAMGSNAEALGEMIKNPHSNRFIIPFLPKRAGSISTPSAKLAAGKPISLPSHQLKPDAYHVLKRFFGFRATAGLDIQTKTSLPGETFDWAAGVPNRQEFAKVLEKNGISLSQWVHQTHLAICEDIIKGVEVANKKSKLHEGQLVDVAQILKAGTIEPVRFAQWRRALEWAKDDPKAFGFADQQAVKSAIDNLRLICLVPDGGPHVDAWKKLHKCLHPAPNNASKKAAIQTLHDWITIDLKEKGGPIMPWLAAFHRSSTEAPKPERKKRKTAPA